MKKITVAVIAILFLILGVKLKDSFSVNIGPKNINTPVAIQGSPSQNKSDLETKESNGGPVSVAVTPKGLEKGLSVWDFDITLNTHSEELNEDLVAISELVDGQGKSYKPISWEGAPPGGHHRQGILKFNPISPKPKSLELNIKNAGGIPERRFKWDL
ncbi:hypothetical protein HYU93_00320 [Candidatus Daviesbacteria bacterium]|nr:hypothetical protein [Candidatus Daviesbacteria bacterium]